MTPQIDSPEWQRALEIIDPVYSFDKLKDIPKFVLVSSDDEFMSMDWTNLGYYDQLEGEKHLCILSNAEHSLATGLFRGINTIGTFISSVIQGKTNRPYIDYQYDPVTGDLSVIVPKEFKPTSVKLRHG
jgi:hypothetical protein